MPDTWLLPCITAAVPKHICPSQIIDVKTSIRFLRAHADEYEIDPTASVSSVDLQADIFCTGCHESDLYESEEWSGYSSKCRLAAICSDRLISLKLIEIDEHEIATQPEFPAGNPWRRRMREH